MDNVNSNTPNDHQPSLRNQIRAHLSSCAINRGPHGWELELRSPSTWCNDFNEAGLQQMVTFNTPKVVPKLRPGVWDIVFICRANTCQKWQKGLGEIYQRVARFQFSFTQTNAARWARDTATCFHWLFKCCFIRYFITSTYSFNCKQKVREQTAR